MESLLDHPVISERYFFPRPDEPAEFRDFLAPDGVRLRCFEHRPHPTAKTLVHYHGNGETVADYRFDFVDAVAKLGLNVLLVEYRGYGGSTGQPQLGKMLDDVAAVRESCGLDPAETFLYGRSVGAIFAVEWASQQPNIAGLILESGVANPHERLSIRLEARELGVDQATFDAACAERLDHQKKLANYRGPLLVLHAAGDSLVTIDHAHSHMEWSASENKKLVAFPRGDHNTIITYNWEAMMSHLGDFLK